VVLTEEIPHGSKVDPAFKVLYDLQKEQTNPMHMLILCML